MGRVEALQDAAQLIGIVLGVGAVPFLMDWVEGRLPVIPRGPRPTSPVARSREAIGQPAASARAR